MLDRADYYYDLGIPASNNNLYIDENGNASYIYRIPYFKIFLLSGLISLAVSLFLYFKTRLVIKKQNSSYYIEANESNIVKKDDLIDSHVTRVYRQSSSSSSSRGGSSFHSSSSGRSHGGGGRRF